MHINSYFLIFIKINICDYRNFIYVYSKNNIHFNKFISTICLTWYDNCYLKILFLKILYGVRIHIFFLYAIFSLELQSKQKLLWPDQWHRFLFLNKKIKNKRRGWGLGHWDAKVIFLGPICNEGHPENWPTNWWTKLPHPYSPVLFLGQIMVTTSPPLQEIHPCERLKQVQGRGQPNKDHVLIPYPENCYWTNERKVPWLTKFRPWIDGLQAFIIYGNILLATICKHSVPKIWIRRLSRTLTSLPKVQKWRETCNLINIQCLNFTAAGLVKHWKLSKEFPTYFFQCLRFELIRNLFTELLSVV